MTITVLEENGASFQDVLKCTPEEFYAAATAGLPQGVAISVVTTGSAQCEIRFMHDHFVCARDINGDTARHVSARTKVSEQGKGILRTVNRNMAAIYDRIGVNKITTEASEVGCYAWPRVGFLPDDATWKDIRRSILNRLDYLESHPVAGGIVPAGAADIVRHAVLQDDPKNIWLVTDQTSPCHGKTLGQMLLVQWLKHQMPKNFPYPDDFNIAAGSGSFEAVLDLRDADCRQRFIAYTGVSPSVKSGMQPKAGVA